MASLKELRNRIASVKATQKITKAMQMVAAAKLRRAQTAAEAARPYAERMDQVLAGLAGAGASTMTLLSIFVPPIHIYKHLRGTYRLSRFSALWRLAVLSVAIMFILLMFTALLALLGLY